MSLDEFSELSDHQVDPRSVRLLPRSFCLRNECVVLGVVALDARDAVTVGMVEPDDVNTRLQVADFLEREIEAVRLNRWEIQRALEIVYDAEQRSHEVVRRHDIGPGATAPKLVDDILAHAVQRGASDIHIESYMSDVDLRFRIDGILHPVFTPINPDNVEAVVSRIKIMASLDITERRRPQDGRIRRRVARPSDDGESVSAVDFRISIVPSPSGEDVVIRVLDALTGLIPLRELGMPSAIESEFETLLKNPEGLVLVTGPTGSGKTTTLYAALEEVNDGRRKIITAEDPIEYYLPKINQKQVNDQMPMSSLLRALLRQDPDVMLVGEVRDLPTGSLALNAATTGHVVLGTLHTSDALGAVPRLRGLELDNAEIADALLAVMAQRLVRAVCPECAEPVAITDAQRELFGTLLDGLEPMRGTGCEACLHTGYQGRIGVFELVVVDPDMQMMIADGAPTAEVRDHARSRGFESMLEDAMGKVADGETTLDELKRVIPYRHIIRAVEESS